MNNIQREIEQKKREIALLESIPQIGEHIPSIEQLIYLIKSSGLNLSNKFGIPINDIWTITDHDIITPYHDDYDGNSRTLILSLKKNNTHHSYYAIPGWYSSYDDEYYRFNPEQLYKCEPVTKTIVEWERID
jgi:hypothetical protein